MAGCAGRPMPCSATSIQYLIHYPLPYFIHFPSSGCSTFFFLSLLPPFTTPQVRYLLLLSSDTLSLSLSLSAHLSISLSRLLSLSRSISPSLRLIPSLSASPSVSLMRRVLSKRLLLDRACLLLYSSFWSLINGRLSGLREWDGRLRGGSRDLERGREVRRRRGGERERERDSERGA